MSPFALKIELLRPRAWLAANAATLGATIHLDLEEMGASGPARVVHIGPAPPLEAGSGQIVTGTFAHSAANVINLYVDGLEEPIGTTASHPFWCEDRQAFVPAGDLKSGERLRTQDGQLLDLTASRPRAADAVFNLEVNTEHVYYVGIHGLLVHNSCDGKGVAPRRSLDEIIEAHGGSRIADDANPLAFSFPSKRAAKQAASEISGNLGRNPEKVLQSSYREPTLSWSAQQSKRVIGKHSQALDEFGNPIAGFHDHFAGHSAFGETRGHINAWGRFGNYKDNIHLFYEN